jgi:nitrate reductase gamma subunit
MKKEPGRRFFGLTVGEQSSEAGNIALVHQQLLGVLTGNFIGFLAPKVAAHAFSAHKLSGSGNVYAGFGTLVCLKFGHLLNLLYSVPLD